MTSMFEEISAMSIPLKKYHSPKKTTTLEVTYCYILRRSVGFLVKGNKLFADRFTLKKDMPILSSLDDQIVKTCYIVI